MNGLSVDAVGLHLMLAMTCKPNTQITGDDELKSFFTEINALHIIPLFHMWAIKCLPNQGVAVDPLVEYCS